MKQFHNIALRLCRKYVLLLVLGLLACDVQVIDVNETEFFIAKEWKIKKVFWDNTEVHNGDLALKGGILDNFRLKLNDDFTYTLIDFDQSEYSGEWQLTSGFKQLTLSDFELESWLIAEINIRSLNISYLSPPNKPDWPLRYELEPVRGQ